MWLYYVGVARGGEDAVVWVDYCCCAPLGETARESAVRAVRQSRNYTSGGWACRPVASDDVDRVFAAAAIARPLSAEALHANANA